MSTTTTPDQDQDQVDVRGPRFVAWVTTAVIVATLIISTFSAPAAAVLLGLQGIVFAVGATRGPRHHPYGVIFRKFVAPRLGPVTEREPVPPLKFAQLVGLVFAVIGTAGFSFGVPLLGVVATAFALFASFLNAAFGICLGCQIYPFLGRFTARLRRTPTASNA